MLSLLQSTFPKLIKIKATIVEPEKDDELVDVIINTDDKTDDSDSEEYFSQQQLAIIQKETKTTMEICFQDFFDKANNMASIFDKQIHIIMEETFESHFNQKFSIEIQKHVGFQTLLFIQKEVKNEVQSKGIGLMKGKVQNAVFDGISKQAQVKCKQIFQNHFVLKVKNHVKTAELEIQQHQVETIERMQDKIKSAENTLK